MGSEERKIIEDNLKILKKLQEWLSKNPYNNPLVTKEADAVLWAIKQFEDALAMTGEKK